MTPEKHVKQLVDSFAKELTPKYMGGLKEKGGKLWEKGGMNYKALEEVYDLYVYLKTQEQQHQEFSDMLKGMIEIDKINNNEFTKPVIELLQSIKDEFDNKFLTNKDD